MPVSQVGFDQAISIGNLLILLGLACGFIILWYKTKRDVELSSIQKWIDRHELDAKEDRFRLAQVEDAVVRLVALQETTERRLKGIEHRHERVDERR